MKTNHTPGPWEEGLYTGDIYAEIEDDHDIRIAAITGEASGLVTADEAKANARLIAAAPDMLEALREAFRLIDGQRTAEIASDKAMMRLAALDIMQAAIDKATLEEVTV